MWENGSHKASSLMMLLINQWLVFFNISCNLRRVIFFNFGWGYHAPSKDWLSELSFSLVFTWRQSWLWNLDLLLLKSIAFELIIFQRQFLISTLRLWSQGYSSTAPFVAWWKGLTTLVKWSLAITLIISGIRTLFLFFERSLRPILTQMCWKWGLWF